MTLTPFILTGFAFDLIIIPFAVKLFFGDGVVYKPTTGGTMNSPLGGAHGRLWSLWDMLKFAAGDWLRLMKSLGEARHQAEGASTIVADGTKMWGETMAATAVKINVLPKLLGEMGLPIAKAAATRLTEQMKVGKSFNPKELAKAYEALENTMADELGNMMFYRVASDKTGFIEGELPLFGSDVRGNFPSATYDITEAGKCLALDRSTACVMHLMRALETPLQTIAGEFSIVIKRENWHDIIKDIEAAVLARDPKIEADKKSFFSAACAQFRFFKDAWRNHAMHARIKYTEEEADIIFRSVKAFMGQLAKRVKE